MTEATPYGQEQARAQMPHIASEALAGYSSVITCNWRQHSMSAPQRW